MGLFFKEGATPKQKAWTLGLYAVLVCLAVGLYSDILINEAILKPMNWIAGVLSIFGVVYSLRALFRKDSRLREAVKAQNRKIWVMVIGILIGIPILCFGFLAKGVPTVLHYTFAKDGDMIVVVNHRSDSYTSKVCTGGVYIEGNYSFFNDEICGLQKDDWEALQPGSIIRLVGKKSVFGFSYDHYQVFRSKSS